MKVDVIMPQMGESIAEGTVLRYLKKVGDPVRRDEDVLEISTDKVDATVPSPAAGVFAEVLVPEGKTVEINTVLARIETDAGAAVGVQPAAAVPAAAPAGSAAAPPAPAAPASGRPAPPPAARSGAGSAHAPAQAAPAPPRGASEADLAAARRAGRIPSPEEMRRVRSTPLVRRIAAEHGVDISTLAGTGISGRVTRQDIMAHLESGAPAAVAAPPAAAPAPALGHAPAVAFGPGEDVHVEPMTQMRRIIAEHMVASRRTSAHVHTVYEVDMTAVAALRDRHKGAWESREGVKLTYLPFILKAAVEALKAYPVVNASIDGDNVVYHRSVHLGIAVALDWGLIVPVVRNADEKNLLGLARAVHDLAGRARTRKLTPDEIRGSTFSVTNPGVFGGLLGTPIINQPNAAILGIGAVQKRPVVINDAIAIRSMAYLVLGYDHRLIDGAVAEQFLAHMVGTLQRGTFTDLG